MKFLISSLMFTFTINVHAAGGIFCEVDDKNIKLSVGGILSRGIPSGPFQTRGSLEFKSKELSKYSQTDYSDIVQYWDLDGQIKMAVYKEVSSEDYFPMLTVIKTKYSEADPDYNFIGTYSLSAGSTKYSGTVKCSLE